MRKKLDTRFPASRIKKIMQADEDVGKIALAVPVLVSKALELFLQDLCDRTYDITLRRGVKTMSALHLKQCVHSYSVFDFLKETVSKVPDLGGSEAGGEDRPKRRKAVDEGNDSEEESKRSRTQEAAAGGHGSSSSRGRGRGRGRGRPRKVDREGAAHYDRCEDDPGTSPQHYDRPPQYLKTETLGEGSSNATDEKETTDGSNTGVIRNFDLNMDLDENGDTSAGTASAMASASSKDCDMKQEEYLGWSQSDVDKMTDPLQLALLNKRVEEEEEDYDNEE